MHTWVGEDLKYGVSMPATEVSFTDGLMGRRGDIVVYLQFKDR